MDKAIGKPTVTAVLAAPYIAIEDWHIDNSTTLHFAKLSLEQAVELRDNLDAKIELLKAASELGCCRGNR